MKCKINVLFLSNIPSPYVVGYLNELGKYCDLTAVFEKQADCTRPDSWQDTLKNDISFKCRILNGIPIGAKVYGDDQGYAPDDKAVAPSVIKYLSPKYDLIIVGNPCTPTGIIAIFYMRIRKIPYAIQSEGGFPGNGKGIKEKLKYFLMRKAVLYFSTCRLDDMYFYTYGATEDKIRRYNFTSMYEKDIPSGVISQVKKKYIKNELGIVDDYMILTVGRSVPIKGFDILIKSFNGIEEYIKSFDKGSSCALYLVGAEEISEYHEIIYGEGIDNIHFIENISFDELKKYYYAADFFVFPTRGDTWGLVINEAMAYGLPVISTNMCVAADALIEDEVNGYIVDVDNVEKIKRAMMALLVNSSLRDEMSQANNKKMQGNTIEQMGRTVYGHIKSYCESR